MAEPTDLAKRFEKLAEEYTKIKTQNAILKKAVLQEQQKNTKLETELKEKDIRLRAATEETDILGFNNQRLTKRVEMLQKAIEEEKSKAAGGGWFGSGAKAELQKTRDAFVIIQEELDTKIKENEGLHIKMFEERREYKATIDTLANKLEQVKLAMKKKADELEDFSNEHKHTVGKLTTDKDNLTARVEELSETLIRTKNLMQQREHSITQMQQKFTIDLENANAVIQEKIIFNDTSNAKFNQLNLPSFDRPLKIKRDEIMASGIVMFKKLADIMKETSDAEHEKLLLANRNPDIIDEMRHLNRKTGQLTQETYAQLTSVLDAFKACATPTGSQEELFLRSSPHLVEQVRKAVSFFQKLANYRKLRWASEVKAPNCSDEMRTSNACLTQNEDSVTALLQKLLNYLTLLFGTGTPETAPSESNSLFFIAKLNSTTTALRDAWKERSSHMSGKISLEQLQDPFISPELKAVNEKLIISLSSAVSMIDKLGSLLGQFLEMVSNPVRYAVRGAKPNYPSGIYPLAPLHCKDEPTIAYADQLKHVQQISELKTELKNRDVSLEQLKSNIGELERHRQKIIAELSNSKDTLASKQSQMSELLAELADTRQKLSHLSTLYQKQQARVKDLEKQIASASYVTAPPSASAPEAAGSSDFEPVAGVANAAAPPPYQEAIVAKKEQATRDLTDLVSFDEPDITTSHPPAYTTTSSGTSGTDLLSFDDSHPILSSPSTSVDFFDTLSGDVSSPEMTDDALSSSDSSLSFPLPDMMQTPTISVGAAGAPKWQMVVMDETGKQSDALSFSMEDKAREADMRRYYEDKFTHLKSQLELADKSGLELISKSAKLEQTLEDAVSERDLLQQQISATNDRILRSKEELETTRENYEAQLKLLTEHLVSLNEKIGTYEEELSQIKSFKVKCGKCSGWNTVGWLMTEGKMGQRCSKGNHPSSLNYA